MPPKTAPLTPDDNVKLLYSMYKHNDDGKPNWNKIAEELGIISAAAAAKRFSRLQKSLDQSPSKGAGKVDDEADDGKDTSMGGTGDDSAAGGAQKAKSKKRKAEGGAGKGKMAKKVKPEPIEEDEDGVEV